MFVDRQGAEAKVWLIDGGAQRGCKCFMGCMERYVIGSLGDGVGSGGVNGRGLSRSWRRERLQVVFRDER